MKIAHKVGITFGLILAILFASFFYANYYLNIIEKDIKLFSIADKMVEDILQVRRHEKNFILRGQAGYADLAKTYLSMLLSEVEDYKRTVYRKHDLENAEELLVRVKTFQKGFVEYADTYKDSEARPESQLLIITGRAISNLSEEIRNELSFYINAYLNNVLRAKIVVLFLLVVLSLFALWLTRRTVVSPIKKLQELCSKIGKDSLLGAGQMELVDKVMKEIDARDEIGELVRVYREMLIRCDNASMGLQAKMKEIEALYSLKSEFTSTVSHELRTPLAPIKEGIELVLDGSVGSINNEQKVFLEIARRNVDRLCRLINNVLDFSKLTSNKIELKTELTDLNEIINSVVDIYKLVIIKKGLSVNVSLKATEGLKVELDPDRVNQVITNLLANAVKFTDQGSITVLTIYEKGMDSLRVCIKDTGIGIENKDLDKLFKPFSQITDKYNKKRGGTGLGLAICKEIIELSGGNILVDSGVGKGSEFCFSLPVGKQE